MEQDYYLSFSISPIGPKRFQKLLKIAGSAKAAWEGSKEVLKEAGIAHIGFARFDTFRKTFNISNYLSKLKKSKVGFIPFSSTDYPESLKKLPDPPIGIYIRGNKKLLQSESLIGIVGARKITSYGRQVTESLASELCSAGFIIVSGMAMGVDGVAHKTAIDSHGATIAILGCGIDCPYPRENEKLYEEILDSNGLVISEYPLGQPANQGTFPARNRIIAGLSSAVLITEAAEDSGSLITANCAIKFGKTVFAVPGPITSQMSRGSIKLLKQGAVMVSSADDILNELKIKNQISKIKNTNQKLINFKLSQEEGKIFRCLDGEGRTIDEISKLTKISAKSLSIILSEMELSGVIKNSGGKFRI